MLNHISKVAIGAYLAVLAIFVWAAYVKYGPEMAAKFVAGGLVLLWILARAWRGFKYIIFGGRLPANAIGRSVVQPPRPSSNPPRP